MVPHVEAIKHLKKKLFYSKCTQTNTYREAGKGSDVANLPHLTAAGLLRLDVSPSWPSTLECK